MPERMEWDALLSGFRHFKPIKEKAGGNLGGRSEFESDYDRVIFSQAFRRLAKKTQVHPLAPNDHIHNRLIHSIEVGSVGRSLGKKLQNFLREQEGIDTSCGAYADIPNIVQVGCLVHDIGNPPFGHAGEYAIREWLAEHEELVFNGDFEVSTELKADLLLFERNAQGFRLAPHSGQDHSRMLSGSVFMVKPQLEQRLLEGYHRSIPISVLPYHFALYSNCRINSDQRASWMERLSPDFCLTLRPGVSAVPFADLLMFFTASVSTLIVWFSRISLVLPGLGM